MVFTKKDKMRALIVMFIYLFAVILSFYQVTLGILAGATDIFGDLVMMVLGCFLLADSVRWFIVSPEQLERFIFEVDILVAIILLSLIVIF